MKPPLLKLSKSIVYTFNQFVGLFFFLIRLRVPSAFVQPSDLTPARLNSSLVNLLGRGPAKTKKK